MTRWWKASEGILLAISMANAANAAAPKPIELFGVMLGAKPSVPDCGGLVMPTHMCWKQGATPLRDILGPKPGEVRDISVFFGEKTPDFVEQFGFSGKLIDGKIEGVAILTKGLQVQIRVFAQLSTKFGKPLGSRIEHAQNGFGAVYDIFRASWLLGGTLITFVGREPDDDYGVIRAETAKLRAIDAADAIRANQGVPRL